MQDKNLLARHIFKILLWQLSFIICFINIKSPPFNGNNKNICVRVYDKNFIHRTSMCHNESLMSLLTVL